MHDDLETPLRGIGSQYIESVGGVPVFAWNPRRVPQGAPEGFRERVANFGDLLGPSIVGGMLALNRVTSLATAPKRLLCVGSIIHFARRGDVLWGVGVNGKAQLDKLPGDLDIRAVRGPITAEILTRRGHRVPRAYGDPALLLGVIWPELKERSGGDGTLIIPNLNDLQHVRSESSGADLLDPRMSPWATIERIRRADRVVSSSLHGLIVADALGVPAHPLASSSEHPLKYIDYYAGTGRTDVRFARTVSDALRSEPVAAPEWDPSPLLEAFPRDLWDEGSSPPADFDSVTDTGEFDWDVDPERRTTEYRRTVERVRELSVM